MDDLLMAETARQVACGESYFGRGYGQSREAVKVVN
jgi:hypothetical protein